MNKLRQIKNAIGNTPLIKIDYSFMGAERTAYLKAEWYNLTGSIKDRVAYTILKNAIKNGKLKKGFSVVEVTSGNMGISIAALCSFLGVKCVIFMPRGMSEERYKILKMYGAEVCVCEDFKDAFRQAKNYSKGKKCFLCEQFDNIENRNAHQFGTAKEVDKVIGSNFDAVVLGVGTGGTLMGFSKRFKKKGKTIFAMEPKNSSILRLGYAKGQHKIQGLSDDIIPGLYDAKFVDDIISVNDTDAIAMAQKINRELGLPVGISGGANFVGCVLSNKRICVSVFPDDNKKYLSTTLIEKVNSNMVNKIVFKRVSFIK